MATILRIIFAQISVHFFVQSRESANWITKASREKSHENKARIQSRKKEREKVTKERTRKSHEKRMRKESRKKERGKSHEKKAQIKSRKKVAKTKNESANLDDT